MRNFQMEQQIRPRRRPPIASCGGGERVFSMGVALVLFLALPFASPFASGTSLYNNASPRPGVPPRPLLTTTRPMAAGEVTTTPNDPKRFSSLRRFIARFTPNKHKSWSKSGGEEQASLSSKLLFRYATPLLQKASEERLEAEDSFDIASDRQMHHSVTRLARIYEHVKSTPQNSNATPAVLLTKALLWHQRPMLLTTGVLRLLNTAIQAFPAILIARLLKLVEAGDALPAHKALTAAVTLVAVLTTKMIVENQYFHRVVQCSTQVRGALAGLIFDKSLRLPAGGGDGVKGETSSSGNSTASSSLGAGAVLNLMQSDASIIESAAMQIHTLWDGPLQIAIYTSLLFRYLGPSVWWGILVLLTTIPVNSVALRALNRLAKYENQAKDARTKRTAESISNMKLLKLQGWEERFANDIRGHRSQELRRHVSRGLVRAINSAISNAVPSLVLVVTLTAFVKTGKPIKASTIFTAISLFNQLRYPLFFYPMLVDSLANGRNAMRRISTFLSSEEIVPYVQHLPPHGGGGGSIELQHGNFLWSTARGGSPRPALSNVNLKVNPGEVVAVVGSVGSGKSALVKALLGELNPVPGMVIQHAIFNDNNSNDRASTTTTDVFEKPTVVTHGNVAYCSQEAWLPKGTIKDAIVFGREYDETRYLAAIRDAGLDKDIVDSLNGANSKSAATSGVLSHDTDVGEGGSSLSGGQRARVALARALYSGEDTKVFLLDDSLAALDASVGSTVFERLTRRLRGSNAAVVLVTNDPSLPRRCDRVVLMGNVPNSSSCSTVVDTGTYDELLARGHNLRSIASVDLERSPESSAEEVTATTVHADGESHTGNIGTRLHRPKFTKIRGDRIRVVGGYNGPSNCTDSCHADPECQAAMEKCPDYASDHALSATPETSTEVAEKEEILVDVYKANSTFDEAMAESSMDVGESSVASTWEPVEKRLASADDSMSVGAVPRSIYVSYFKSVRQPLLVFAMVAFYLVSNGAQFYQQFVVAKWTEVGSGAMAAALNLKYMRRLVQAAGVVSLSLWLRSVMTMQVGVRASEHLHSQMLSSVFKAPMSFFDATPSGQLLSRFGKEMETVDRGVPDSMQSVLFCFLQIFMSIGALAGVVTPAMLAPIFVVGVLYGKAMSMFRPASRDLKRAETKTRSPIYTHFGEALRGTDTIRSIPGARQYWSEKHRSLTDKNLGVFYTVKALDRWLSTRLETLGNTVVLTAAVASVLLTRAGRLKSGSAGWGLTQSLAITGLLTWAVRCLTDLESNMYVSSVLAIQLYGICFLTLSLFCPG